MVTYGSVIYGEFMVTYGRVIYGDVWLCNLW